VCILIRPRRACAPILLLQRLRVRGFDHSLHALQ
jgi:hypothetical protein